MKPEEQRIAIAEACGWKKCRMGIYGAGAPEIEPIPYGFSPTNSSKLRCIPKYCEDLNACHEMEKIIHYPDSMDYINHIRDITSRDKTLYVSATAAQRAEAFLRTLNLWKD